MRFPDGALALFTDCEREHEVCALVERRDAQGHRIEYVRDSTGRLLRMESEGQSIALDYDDHKRIVHARDTSNHIMDYTYDEGGRLVRALGSDGTLRQYAYNDRDELTAVREPNRIVQNWFDAAGRVVRQEVRSSENDNDPYVATVRYVVENKSIVQSDFDEGDGIHRSRYNSAHDIVSETFYADTLTPMTFSYDRVPATGVLIGATLSCLGLAGPITLPVTPTSAEEDSTKQALIHANCVTR